MGCIKWLAIWRPDLNIRQPHFFTLMSREINIGANMVVTNTNPCFILFYGKVSLGNLFTWITCWSKNTLHQVNCELEVQSTLSPVSRSVYEKCMLSIRGRAVLNFLLSIQNVSSAYCLWLRLAPDLLSNELRAQSIIYSSLNKIQADQIHSSRM